MVDFESGKIDDGTRYMFGLKKLFSISTPLVLWMSVLGWVTSLLLLWAISSSLSINLIYVMLALTGSLLVALAMTQFITNALYKLQVGIQNFKSGQQVKPLPCTGPTEISNLMKEFNKLVKDYNGKNTNQNEQEVLSLMAHEIKNSLVAIKGYSEMAQEVRSKSQKLKLALNSIDEANERLTRFVNDLLQITKFESGQLQISLSKVKISNILSQVIQNYKSMLGDEKRKLKLIYDRRKYQRVSVNTDKVWLYQILNNLISNAIKYTNKGQVEIKHYFSKQANKIVVPKKQSDSKFLVTEVKDTGIGIVESEQSAVFDKFFRGSNVNQDMEGNGLGNYIVKQLTEKLGGKVWVESKEGKGSSFYFSIPFNK